MEQNGWNDIIVSKNQKCNKKALKDFLKIMSHTWNPIKYAVKALGRRETIHVIIGDAIMKTLYEQLLSVDSILSEKMVHTIKSKINEAYTDKLM